MLVAVPRPALDRIGIGNNSIEDRKRTLNHSTEAVPPGQRFCRSAILAFLKVRGKRFNAAKLTGSRQVTTPTLQSHTDVEACPNNHQHLPTLHPSCTVPPSVSESTVDGGRIGGLALQFKNKKQLKEATTVL